MYDAVIIGAGPAGISAAINLKLLGKNFLWVASEPTSLKAARAELIKNYPGLPDVTGEQLCWALKNHAESMGARLTDGVATGVFDTVGKYSVLVGDESYDTRTVILCTGVVTSKPLKGESEFLGRGVSYCAVCDGFLYKGKTICAVIYDKKFEHEAEYLCSLAHAVYVLPMYKNCNISAQNARFVDGKPLEISGGLRAETLKTSSTSVSADGFFVLRASVAPATLVKGIETDGGRIIADRKCATNLAGVFAAGDCTGAPYQYAKAVGEGNVAAHSAAEYIDGVK